MEQMEFDFDNKDVFVLGNIRIEPSTMMDDNTGVVGYDAFRALMNMKQALEFIASGDISPASIKEQYIDQAYSRIAREALKGLSE